MMVQKQFWPTTVALDEMRQEDEWLNIQENSFSIEKIGPNFRNCRPLSAQDADRWRGHQPLDGPFQMAILICMSYCAHISFCLTFWGISLQNILIKLLVAGCLLSKRQTIHCAPSSSALYGVIALHVLALQKCAAMWLHF